MLRSAQTQSLCRLVSQGEMKDNNKQLHVAPKRKKTVFFNLLRPEMKPGPIGCQLGRIGCPRCMRGLGVTTLKRRRGFLGSRGATVLRLDSQLAAPVAQAAGGWRL
ncbi:hypothetical protein D8674_041139 [Pyrus ussuriensis x Pyrus communis]|uniref:Uncharacterized protein n=1 Tax=Pyrus ussuriensis x Pyrus communis TaxID=2448454 RepID=A0A5N5GG05_9ROSA|nr:hypothetical protein D8674_041139 [Pyrus ussuriensis x Pyrus communis]